MTANKRIEELAQQFLAQLVDLAREEVMQLLGSGTSTTSAKRGVAKATRNGTKKTNGRLKKGAKRDPADLDRLQTKVYAYIEANPKQRVEEINAALKTSTKQLALPIKKLVASGALRTTGTRRATRYSVGKKSRK